MKLSFKQLMGAIRERFRRHADPETQFEMINDALEDGDFETVLEETDKIISRSRYVSNFAGRVLAKTRFFNSSEEYNNYLLRHPTQSYISWEFPLAPEAHFHRAMVFQKSGRLKSSREEIEKSLMEFPDSAKYLVELGFILFNMKQYSDAAAAFERALENDLTDDRLYSSRAQIGLGLLHLEQADYRGAKRCLNEARRLSPDNREVMAHLHLLSELETDPRQRADYFLGVGSFDSAMEAFNEALLQNPNDFDMHLGIAFTYKELQQFDLAEKHIKKAFQYNPGSAQVNFALGWTYLMQDRPELAEEEIIKAIRKNPYDGGFYVGLAYVYLERARAGEIIEADKLISATTRAAELDPHYPESYMILAEYYQLEENLAAARKAIESAVRISPNNQSAHILAAEIYLELGRKKRSMHHLNEAADFGRDTEEMRQLRDRLQGEDL
jgi:tetratricopeptide (TPR) repeat protein